MKNIIYCLKILTTIIITEIINVITLYKIDILNFILPVSALIISILALIVNYSTKNLTSFKYSFDLLIKYEDKLETALTQLKHKDHGEWVTLGLILDNNTTNKFLKNKLSFNDTSLFSKSSPSYVPHENFIQQVELVLDFICNANFLFPKKFYVRQLRSILSEKSFFFLYLYATFSKNGLPIANLIQISHLFGDESKDYIPKNLKDTLYVEDVAAISSQYFLNNKRSYTIQKDCNENKKCLYQLIKQ